MKSVGEVMAIGRTFKEALLKAVRSLETGKKAGADSIEPRILTKRLVTPHPERCNISVTPSSQGMTVRKSRASPAWTRGSFTSSRKLATSRQSSSIRRRHAEQMRQTKRMGITDARLGELWNLPGRVGRREGIATQGA